MDITCLYKSKLTILHGRNGCGKTRVLNMLKNYLSTNNNIIFFSSDRVMNFSKSDIDSIDIMLKLENQNSFKYRIENAYDIKDEFSLSESFNGSKIMCGYIQLLNFFYTIYTKLSCEKNNIVIIDNIELSLHPLVIIKLIDDIIEILKIDKLIISTHSNHLIQYYSMLKQNTFSNCELIDVQKIGNDIFNYGLIY